MMVRHIRNGIFIPWVPMVIKTYALSNNSQFKRNIKKGHPALLAVFLQSCPSSHLETSLPYLSLIFELNGTTTERKSSSPTALQIELPLPPPINGFPSFPSLLRRLLRALPWLCPSAGSCHAGRSSPHPTDACLFLIGSPPAFLVPLILLRSSPAGWIISTSALTPKPSSWAFISWIKASSLPSCSVTNFTAQLEQRARPHPSVCLQTPFVTLGFVAFGPVAAPSSPAHLYEAGLGQMAHH